MIDTRTYGNVTRSFDRGDWTEADINFYVQHILPQEVKDEQETWDRACEAILANACPEVLADYRRLRPRPQLAEDHPLPDPRSYALSVYDDYSSVPDA